MTADSQITDVGGVLERTVMESFHNSFCFITEWRWGNKGTDIDGLFISQAMFKCHIEIPSLNLNMKHLKNSSMFLNQNQKYLIDPRGKLGLATVAPTKNRNVYRPKII